MKIFQWFRKEQKVKEVDVELSKGLCANFPLDKDLVYQVNGIELVGCYLGSLFNSHQFAIADGVLNVGSKADIRLVRNCTTIESSKIAQTKLNIESHNVVTFLQLDDVVAAV